MKYKSGIPNIGALEDTHLAKEDAHDCPQLRYQIQSATQPPVTDISTRNISGSQVPPCGVITVVCHLATADVTCTMLPESHSEPRPQKIGDPSYTERSYTPSVRIRRDYNIDVKIIPDKQLIA